jgi:hypothetical protein
MSWKPKLTFIAGSLALFAGLGGLGYKIGVFGKQDKHVETAYKEPEKKIEEILVPEAPKAEPKEETKTEQKEEPKQEPKAEQKEEPKIEAPKWEAKPILYQAKAVFENPVTYAIAMEQWRVEVAYKKATDEPMKEDNMTRAYRFAKAAGSDGIVQRSELKTSELETKVEELRKKDNKPYDELNMGSLSISNKVEDAASITIIPADEAQEKRLYALVEHRTKEQAAYTAAMISLHSKEGKISDEKIAYIEQKVAEKYGGKK